jgi:hypothetical protein
VNGSGDCSLCQQSTFSTAIASTSSAGCQACPVFSDSPEGSNSISKCACSKGYTGSNSICIACVERTYKAMSGSTLCLSCPIDTYSKPGSFLLINCSCLTGFSGEEGAGCVACFAGTYKDVNGSADCTLCSQGKYSTATAAIVQDTCKDCPSYTYSGAGSMLLTNCTCNEGYTGPDGMECAACIAGTYKSSNGSTPCSLCSAGKYSTETGAISEATFSSCPAHTYSGAGSKVLVNCTCNKGYTGPDGVECTACGAGGFKDTNGSAACTLCSQGKYSTAIASISEATCSNCPAHTYSFVGSSILLNCTCNEGYTGPDGVACTACNAGGFKDTNGSAACTLCSQGKYLTATAAIVQDTCVSCPSYTHSGAGSGLLTNCTCNKGYTGADGMECAACIAGTYKGSNGSSPCSLCSEGTYSTGTGEISEITCTECPPHSFSGHGSSAILNCTCNKGFTGPNGWVCTECNAGSYKDVNGSAPCSLCSQGTYSTATTAISQATCVSCPSYTYSVAGSRLLTNCSCNKGYTGPDGAACTACVAGSYKEVNGSSPCSLCNQGKYSTETGAISEATCSNCPAHTYSGAGSQTLVNCTCNKGYTGPDGVACTACGAGGFKDTNGSAACTLCSQGKYSTATAAIVQDTCVSCPSYMYSGMGSRLLTNCTCNEGYTGPDGVECAACIAGTYKDWEVSGSSPCSLCSKGKYSTDTGAISEATCSDCPAHTYSGVGSGILLNCTCNKGYTGPDGVECTACGAGGFKDTNGSAACTLCSQGKYSTATAAISEATCINCPSYTHSGAGSGLLTNCTCNKGYTGPDGVACTACGAGGFKDTNGSAACTLCSQGKYLTATAAIVQDTCVSCPSDTHSGAGSMLLTSCTCNKGYTGPDGAACTACVAGSYKEVNGSSPCSLCNQGKYSTATAAISEATCINCPSYTHSGAGSRLLTNCTCNKGYTGPDGVACTACGAGGFKDTNGSAACTLCSQGKYSTATAAIVQDTCVSCPSYMYSGMGSRLLTNCTCNEGYTGPDGVECAACIAGTYKDWEVSGSSPCSLCSKGKYSTDTGAISEATCSDCPAHTYSGVGSGILLNCTCNKGYTGPDGVECTACGAGGFKNTNGSAACTLCSQGKYSTATAAISEATCSNCPSYTHSGAGSGLLTNCTCNKGYTGPDGVECTACGAGGFKDTNGSAACTLCSQGKYATATAAIVQDTCQDCALHTWSPTGSTREQDCLCDLGYTGPYGSSCVACEVGTYKDINGSAPCKACPSLTQSSLASVSVTLCECIAGHVGLGGAADLNTTMCEACVGGLYKSGVGGGPCAQCPSGSYAVREGSDAFSGPRTACTMCALVSVTSVFSAGASLTPFVAPLAVTIHPGLCACMHPPFHMHASSSSYKYASELLSRRWLS